MKRLERLGSIAFVTVLISFVFHLLGMSFNYWVENNCNTCNTSDPLASWRTALRERCYQSSLASIFLKANETAPVSKSSFFIAKICIPNIYLMPREPQYASTCLAQAQTLPDTVCLLGRYNKTACLCDYTSRTKNTLAMTILAALLLGIMIFLSHLISFVKLDYILRWLIPLCFSLLILAIMFIIIAISVLGSQLDEDVTELRYSWSLKATVLQDPTLIQEAKQEIDEDIEQNYTIRVGWCFGMEILSLYFAFITLILYALMFIAKLQPSTKQK